MQVVFSVARRLAVDYDGVRPDVVVLGKALSGGTMPVSQFLLGENVLVDILNSLVSRFLVCWPTMKSCSPSSLDRYK